MARDRKRAKQRQRRQQRTASRAAVAQRHEADVEASDADLEASPADVEASEANLRAPGPLDHASAEVDLAEVAERGGLPADEPGAGEPDEVFDDELEPVAAGDDDRGGRGRRGVKASDGASPERARTGGGRFINFLRACVAELRRVQWPDRRQVTQATGVVLGFVIIAGAYLGLLDALWSRVVSAIL
jgi:preprotein translocase subunit SecE